MSDLTATMSAWAQELQKRELRPTYQRVRVLDYLHQVGGHPTADEIFAALGKQIPSLSKATVYNTLRVFLAAGLVRTISLNAEEKRFDLILSNHGHFVCHSCGRIFNFRVAVDALDSPDLVGFQISERNVFYKGLCPDCLSLSTTHIQGA